MYKEWARNVTGTSPFCHGDFLMHSVSPLQASSSAIEDSGTTSNTYLQWTLLRSYKLATCYKQIYQFILQNEIVYETSSGTKLYKLVFQQQKKNY